MATVLSTRRGRTPTTATARRTAALLAALLGAAATAAGCSMGDVPLNRVDAGSNGDARAPSDVSALDGRACGNEPGCACVPGTTTACETATGCAGTRACEGGSASELGRWSAACAAASPACADGGTGDVALPDGGGACDPTLAPPRLIAPLSTLRVSSPRPTLRWVLAPGTLGVHLEICRDRACAHVVESQDVAGASTRPTSDLAIGGTAPAAAAYFWRATSIGTSQRGCSASAVWELFVGRPAARGAVDTTQAPTLDVNGDGLMDLAVSAPTGHQVAIYAGGSSGTTAFATLDGPTDFGWQMANAADVNGDGLGDVVIIGIHPDSAAGMPGAPPTGVFTALGRTDGGMVATPQAVGLLASTPATFVVALGDVNADGYGDVLVVRGWATTMPAFAWAYVYLGGPTGLAATPAASYALPAEARGGIFDVQPAGDVNGDGRLDVLVASSDPERFSRGYVFYGAPGGIDGASPAVISPFTNATGSTLRLQADDLNGDGYSDVLMGQELHTGGMPDVHSGHACVFWGSSTGVASSSSTCVDPPYTDPVLVAVTVGAPGDVNGDGFGDVLVSSFYESFQTGAVYLYLGTATGLASTPAARLAPEAAHGSFFGMAFGRPGDYDGDGLMDPAVALMRDGVAAGVDLFAGSAAGVGAMPARAFTGPVAGAFGTRIAARRALRTATGAAPGGLCTSARTLTRATPRGRYAR